MTTSHHLRSHARPERDTQDCNLIATKMSLARKKLEGRFTILIEPSLGGRSAIGVRAPIASIFDEQDPYVITQSFLKLQREVLLALDRIAIVVKEDKSTLLRRRGASPRRELQDANGYTIPRPRGLHHEAVETILAVAIGAVVVWLGPGEDVVTRNWSHQAQHEREHDGQQSEQG